MKLMNATVLKNVAFFGKFLIRNRDWRAVQRSVLCRYRRELSNEYVLFYLQKSPSIQPRTSRVKFPRSPRTDRPGRRVGDRVAWEGLRPSVHNAVLWLRRRRGVLRRRRSLQPQGRRKGAAYLGLKTRSTNIIDIS